MSTSTAGTRKSDEVGIDPVERISRRIQIVDRVPTGRAPYDDPQPLIEDVRALKTHQPAPCERCGTFSPRTVALTLGGNPLSRPNAGPRESCPAVRTPE